VTVRFGNQTKSAKAGTDGKWIVRLDPLKASREPRKLQIGSTTISDVLVGEVWICSGQSNMEMKVSKSMNATQEMAAANHPSIRFFNVAGRLTSSKPKDDVPGRWEICAPQSIRNFSAAGYFFGRRLSQELKVPIGLISTGSVSARIEPWMNLEGFRSVPELGNLASKVQAMVKGPDRATTIKDPSALYNAKTHPFVKFALRGVAWYQGESNANDGLSYYPKQNALINGWRKVFHPDLAFYWVQVANYSQDANKPEGGDRWAKLRDAQKKSLGLPNTGMAVTIDIGETSNIHPKNKQDVGARLAQWALHQTYGRKALVPSGPLYKSHRVAGNQVRIQFDHVGSGLMVGKKDGLAPTRLIANGKLARFSIAGADKKWVWADAVISGNEIIVSSPKVARPVAVRYAFTTNPLGANLYNREGLPASPFRTDDW
jgi:sialate O-acetylesterase